MKTKTPACEQLEQIIKYGLDDAVLNRTRLFIYDKDEYLCTKGQPITHLLFILTGKAKVNFITENGKTLLLSFYQAGGVLGDLEFMLGEYPAQSTVQALTEMTCLAVPLKQGLALLQKNSTFLYQIGRGLARKFDLSTRNSAQNILYSLEARLCSYIDLASHDGTFHEKLTEVSELLGTSYRHLLRTLESLCSRGILKKTPVGYIIMDGGTLRLLGQGVYGPVVN